MKKAIIYHNPRCSKSRESYNLLKDHFDETNIEEVRYLDTVPSEEKLQELCNLLEIQPSQLARTKESLYKELGLDKRDIDEQEWLQILNQNPKLIERPIVVIDGRAVLGRPPENVSRLIKELN
ncbi:arsenate reductase (glutaredoxin) [Thiomicrorhabdus sp.]|uniref:arsenate reductase (glutaredoxin) n=1 Tax=Thiomicrorhabdus sp. TaxID=2039724 RepID=UPI0029C65F1D|nr:arsenate reductase (glutaredoxin) [Thiomicrorhabdus sp.]